MKFKSILLLFFSFCLLFILCSCKYLLNSISNIAEKDYEIILYEQNDVTLSLESVTREEATFLLKNETSDNITGDFFFVIEKQSINGWKHLYTTADAPAVSFTCEASNEYLLNESWEFALGKLPVGKYRLIKELSFEGNSETFFVACEFNIT